MLIWTPDSGAQVSAEAPGTGVLVPEDPGTGGQVLSEDSGTGVLVPEEEPGIV